MLLLLYKITIAFFEDKVYYIIAKNDKKESYDKMIKVITDYLEKTVEKYQINKKSAKLLFYKNNFLIL